jgi:hypothetical protein
MVGDRGVQDGVAVSGQNVCVVGLYQQAVGSGPCQG